MTHLAQALVGLGDIDEGATVASNALGRLGAITSARVRDDLLSLRGRLEGYGSVPAVQGYLSRLTSV